MGAGQVELIKRNDVIRPMILALVFLTWSGSSLASSFVIPNTFYNGNTADASDVNENFRAARTAINDNDRRIGTVKSTISNHATRLNDLEKPTSSSRQVVSVAGHAFTEMNYLQNFSKSQNCVLAKDFYSTGARFVRHSTAPRTGCDAIAGVQLPHGRTIKSLSCTVSDHTNDSDFLQITLRRVDKSAAGDSGGDVYQTPKSWKSRQWLHDSIVNKVRADEIDNYIYSYYLHANFSGDMSKNASNLLLHGCTIDFD